MEARTKTEAAVSAAIAGAAAGISEAAATITTILPEAGIITTTAATAVKGQVKGEGEEEKEVNIILGGIQFGQCQEKSEIESHREQRPRIGRRRHRVSRNATYLVAEGVKKNFFRRCQILSSRQS